MNQDRMQLLAAYHDGELSWLGRWRARRLLARDPEARAELAGLESLGGLMREIETEAPAPDLWDAVRLRLPALDARRGEAAAAPPGGAARWVGAGLATVAAALALVIGIELSAVGGSGSVRWLDSRGNPVVVLQDDREATIIWLLEGSTENVSRRTGSAIS